MRLAYLHLPRFPVQRKLLERPSLRLRPFVLTSRGSGQPLVRFASGAARRAGIFPGMGLLAARAVAPELVCFDDAQEADAQALAALGELLGTLAPRFELDAPEGMWLDASAASLRGGEPQWSASVLQRCAKEGYWAKLSCGPGRFVTRALGRHGKERVACVANSDVPRALAELPLDALDEAEAVAFLRSLGLSRLGEVASLPEGALAARLGGLGHRVHARCRGEDEALLVPTPLPERIDESFDFEEPVAAIEPLFFVLERVFERVGERLQSRDEAASRLLLTLRLESGRPQALLLRPSRPTASRKRLAGLARHHLSELRLDAAISGFSIRVEESCEAPRAQRALGELPEGDSGLDEVLARLRGALGEEALWAAEPKDSHRPETAFGKKTFRPPSVERGLLAETRDAFSDGLPEAMAEGLLRPSRLFRTPEALEVELGPKGELLGARFSGRRRRVLERRGPERLCGEWWDRSPYGRDYYRVFLEGVGPAWIYRDLRDGKFYLQGMFD